MRTDKIRSDYRIYGIDYRIPYVATASVSASTSPLKLLQGFYIMLCHSHVVVTARLYERHFLSLSLSLSQANRPNQSVKPNKYIDKCSPASQIEYLAKGKSNIRTSNAL
jgi:hypothetical protein